MATLITAIVVLVAVLVVGLQRDPTEPGSEPSPVPLPH